MKVHIGVDTDSGLVYRVRGTPGHMSDIAEGNTLLHGQRQWLLVTRDTKDRKAP